MDDRSDVIVVGGGLAALGAALAARRTGASVRLVHGRRLGGRAQSDVRAGFTFNRGPHALFRRGVGQAVLDELGVTVSGWRPPLGGARGLLDGRLERFPTTPIAMARTHLLGGAESLSLARILATLPRRPDQELAARSTTAWIASVTTRPQLAAVLAALFRLSTYAFDLDTLSADAGVAQLRQSLGGVRYLDGGWQSMVDALARAATEAGVLTSSAYDATEVIVTEGACTVVAGDRSYAAATVVVATGGPDTTQRLLSGLGTELWEDLGPPVVATCVDYGLERPPPLSFILGVDEPLYASLHAPKASMAPSPGAVVCAMRYGPTDDARATGDELDNLVAHMGVAPGDVRERRLLASLTVAHSQPAPGRGLAGRPSVAVPGTDRCFIAGDWVGPEGLLADAALASGRAAGRAAAARARPTSSPR